jgi:hypothetical protein
MAFFDYFKNLPHISWSFNSVQEIYELIQNNQEYINLKRILTNRINTSIKPVIFDMGMKFNLGGEQEKQKLITTDKPLGIFDFSLASKGLYRVPEYYSIELERNDPNKFINLGLHAGVIPPNLVQSRNINGVKIFYFQDYEKEYHVTQRQKGTTGIEQGDPNSKLKFATKNKKVYLKFRRQGGKVKYCEIYTLYYYTSMGSDWQYNMRHLPVILLAEYFESIGIKTRLYPTRFVELSNLISVPPQTSQRQFKEYDDLTGTELPQYKIAEKSTDAFFDSQLVVLPLMVKDFGQEIDYFDILAISDSNSAVYESLLEESYQKEFTGKTRAYGNPDFEQIEYRTGFERYKNKYAKYVELGLWKSKEVQPEAQLFFHSISIKRIFSDFWNDLIANFNSIDEYKSFKSLKQNISLNSIEQEALILEFSPLVRDFFEWWMKLCCLRLKTQMSLINSKTPRKSIKESAQELYSYADSIDQIINRYEKDFNEKLSNSQDSDEISKITILLNVINNLKSYRDAIYLQEDMTIRGANDPSKPDAKLFIESIINETTIFAEKDFFPTPKEEIEKRMTMADYLIEELNFL